MLVLVGLLWGRTAGWAAALVGTAGAELVPFVVQVPTVAELVPSAVQVPTVAERVPSVVQVPTVAQVPSVVLVSPLVLA